MLSWNVIFIDNVGGYNFQNSVFLFESKLQTEGLKCTHHPFREVFQKDHWLMSCLTLEKREAW